MNNFFNNLQKEARMLRLSTEEKQAMRMHLYNVMQNSPAYTAAQKSAAASARPQGRIQPRQTRMVPSMYYWFSPRFSVPVAILLLVGLSGGTTFAAQSALPGEPLYAVKINVNERVVIALATSPTAKAQVNASLATTRLEEAETLASTGKLDATTTLELAGNFAEHADAAQANTVAVAVDDPGTAAQLGATFSSTLAAHGAILAQLSTDSATGTVKDNSDALAVQVLAQSERGRDTSQEGQGAPVNTGLAITAPAEIAPTAPTTDAVRSADTINPEATTTSAPAIRVRTFGVLARPEGHAAQTPSEASAPSDASTTATQVPVSPRAAHADSTRIADDTNQDDDVIAIALGTQASSTLSTAQADFAAIGPLPDASTTVLIQTQLTALGQLLMQGNNALIAGDNSSAKDLFRRVLRASVRLDAFLKAGKKFDGNFLSSLLK